MIQAPGTISWWLPQSPINPDPCGTFSWPTSQSPFSPFLPGNISPAAKATWQKGAPQSHVVLCGPVGVLCLGSNPRTSLPLQPISDSSYSQLHLPAFPILPALLGCHSKSGQGRHHGVEPIFSKLSCRCCNHRELLPSYNLGGSHSQPPGSKQGHSYLTYL